MKRIDFVKMGFKNLWRRKLRTILTIMGVVIGTFSIVIMVSLGVGMTEGYKEEMAQWGSLTKITISKNSYVWDEDTGTGTSKTQKLDDAFIATLKAMDHVKAVTPTLTVSAYLKSGKYQSYVSIVGIDPDCVKYFDFPDLKSGEYLSNDNPTAVLFGAEACYFYNPKSNRFGGEQPDIDLMDGNVKITFGMDSTKTQKYEKLRVAGVMEESTGEFGYSAYAPIEQVVKWYKEAQKMNNNKVTNVEYQEVWVSVDDVDYVSDVQSQIKDMGYTAYSMADELDNVKETSNMLQLILGGIGAVSLLVSAIGIANTMIMSIYERTKEIGVMKVLGCLVTDIRKIFLFEASIIGFCGGIIGVGLSYLVSYILNKYAPEIGSAIGLSTSSTISVIPLWLSIVAVAFAMFVGIVSGLYPARKATKIKPLEAIRSE
jgi:putative ABC transport system permease protein